MYLNQNYTFGDALKKKKIAKIKLNVKVQSIFSWKGSNIFLISQN